MFCLAVYLMLFSASYYLHSPSTASGACYKRRACIDNDMLRLAAAACCDMGWILAQRDVMCDWSVSKKTGSMYKHRRWSLWTLCCDTACLTFELPHITTGSFQSHRRQPTIGSLQSSNVWKNATNLQSDDKVSQYSQVSVVTFSGGVGKWITDCFLVR